MKDCNKLFNVLAYEKGDVKRVDECLKILYRIVMLMSNNYDTKLRSATIKYLCQHPVLPSIIVDIIKETNNLNVCANTVKILSLLILRNKIVNETDRSIIRKVFINPTNFKAILDAFRNVNQKFGDKENNQENVIRLIRVLNCLYVKRGQTQISLIEFSTVKFIGNSIEKCRDKKELALHLLPLCKILCRNKKNCSILCNEKVLSIYFAFTANTTKITNTITMLKLMSRNAEAVFEMSKSEKTFNFILTSLHIRNEKPINKKNLITTLYRISKPSAGLILISRLQHWSMLLNFVKEIENSGEQRLRLTTIKAYTILYNGVKKITVPTQPVHLDLNIKSILPSYCQVLQSDESENDESDEEDDEQKRAIKRKRCVSEDRFTNEDSFEDEEEDTETCVTEDEDSEIVVDNKDKQSNENLSKMKSYFQEMYSEKCYDDVKLKILKGVDEIARQNWNAHLELKKIIEGRVKKDKQYKQHAFPDSVHAGADPFEQLYINQTVNVFPFDAFIKKLKLAKGIETDVFQRKIVYDINAHEEDPDFSVLFSPQKFASYIQNEVDSGTKIDGPTVRNKSSAGSKTKQKRIPPTLKFESRFESGNLRSVEQIGDYEYNFYLTPDVNTSTGHQWFYFQITNMIADEIYTFNIVNFQKVNSQFNHGMQPVLFSVKNYVLNEIEWRKVGDKIVYYGNEYVNEENMKQCRTLSFNVTFDYTNDYCYIAYHYPYTYSRLMAKLLSFAKINPDETYARIDNLCSTIRNENEVPLITITAGKNSKIGLKIPIENRPIIFLTSRVHPGESNASWIMDGLIDCLLDENNERAGIARERFIFKIIPMLNPEGVVYGNTRVGITGHDLNRCWKKPHPILHPEIYYAKKLVQYVKNELHHPIYTFIDIHGHSRKKYFFFYGCNPKQSWCESDKVMEVNDSSYTAIPRALTFNDNMKLSFCRYIIEKKRESTCRVVMWREFDINCSYTLECSYCAGENKKKMSTKMLRDIGYSIIVGLSNTANNLELKK